MTTGPVPIAESRILHAFAEKTPGSRALHNRAKALFPAGVTHVGRSLDPFPIYVERASGSRKCDVDGNEYVDYAIRRRGLKWCAYGQFSDFHLYRGTETPKEVHEGKARWRSLKGAIQLELVNKIRAGFLLHGVDIAAWPGGLTSAAHTDDDVARTVAAFESTFDLLAAEGAL
jgi:glutamate-1-semialdehyde aminotransferase